MLNKLVKEVDFTSDDIHVHNSAFQRMSVKW